jgi:hypothetical protein
MCVDMIREDDLMVLYEVDNSITQPLAANPTPAAVSSDFVAGDETKSFVDQQEDLQVLQNCGEAKASSLVEEDWRTSWEDLATQNLQYPTSPQRKTPVQTDFGDEPSPEDSEEIVQPTSVGEPEQYDENIETTDALLAQAIQANIYNELASGDSIEDGSLNNTDRQPSLDGDAEGLLKQASAQSGDVGLDIDYEGASVESESTSSAANHLHEDSESDDLNETRASEFSQHYAPVHNTAVLLEYDCALCKSFELSGEMVAHLQCPLKCILCNECFMSIDDTECPLCKAEVVENGWKNLYDAIILNKFEPPIPLSSTDTDAVPATTTSHNAAKSQTVETLVSQTACSDVALVYPCFGCKMEWIANELLRHNNCENDGLLCPQCVTSLPPVRDQFGFAGDVICPACNRHAGEDDFTFYDEYLTGSHVDPSDLPPELALNQLNRTLNSISAPLTSNAQSPSHSAPNSKTRAHAPEPPPRPSKQTSHVLHVPMYHRPRYGGMYDIQPFGMPALLSFPPALVDGLQIHHKVDAHLKARNILKFISVPNSGQYADEQFADSETDADATPTLQQPLPVVATDATTWLPYDIFILTGSERCQVCYNNAKGSYYSYVSCTGCTPVQRSNEHIILDAGSRIIKQHDIAVVSFFSSCICPFCS